MTLSSSSLPRTLCLLLVLPALLALTSCRNHEDEGGYEAKAVQIEGIRNARQVGDILFGGQPSQTALERLHDEGYRTILTSRGEGELKWDEKAKVEGLGMRFISIPMAPPLESISEAQIDQFDKAMKSAPRPMLLHCGSGNRISGLFALWLAKRKGLPAEEALRLGEKAGMTRIRPLIKKLLGLPKDS